MLSVETAHPTALATAPETISDAGIAEFIDLAETAHVYFDLVSDRLTVRAVNPNWEMWSPIRHMLHEIGTRRIEAYLRTRSSVLAGTARKLAQAAA